jgi:hypothetical protein
MGRDFLSLLAISGSFWGATIVFGAVEELDQSLTCIEQADTAAAIDACNN